jgi:hypothetical protein
MVSVEHVIVQSAAPTTRGCGGGSADSSPMAFGRLFGGTEAAHQHPSPMFGATIVFRGECMRRERRCMGSSRRIAPLCRFD